MSVTRKELLERREAFHRLVNELGLAPPPTSPGASSYNVKALDASTIPAIKAVAVTDSSSNKWIIAPSTIGPPINEPTAASIITDFLETAQTAMQLAKEINSFSKFTSPDDSRKIAVIVGKCTKDFPKAQSCEQLFSTIFTPESQQKIYTRGGAAAIQASEKIASKEARLAVLAGINQSDKDPQNDPSITNSISGNRANCSVSTIFVHAATHHEGMGGPDASLFLNYIPNYLISRAFPVLDLTIDLPDGLDQRKLIQALGPSLILGDSIGLKKAPKIDGMFTKTIDPATGETRQPGRAIGNDTFNTPQTLSYSRNRITTLLNEPNPSPVNQFSPIATIQDFSIDFDGGDLSSLMTREAVKGSLVLLFPDKTKITGLDQLLIGTNDLLTLTIDLGWSVMPNQTVLDGSNNKHYLGSGDPMLRYINSQKIRLNCTTTLSGMEFTDSGAVKVTLGLTDPANYDNVEPPHVSDVPDFMKVYNKSDPRFVKFVTTVLNKAGSKSSGVGTDDIAINTGYTKAISHLFKASKKKALNKKHQKQIHEYAKIQNSTHYKIDDLEAIKGGAKLKDGDLIVQHIDTIENTNQSETKGYDYTVINVKKGGRVKDLVEELIENVEALKDKKGVTYPKSIDKDLAFLKACLAEKFLFHPAFPEGRDIPKTRIFGQLVGRAEAVAKAHKNSTKKLKGVDTNGPLSAATTIINASFKSSADSWLSTMSEKLKGTEWIELPPPDRPWLTKLFYGGKIKLDYPKTLMPPMTKKQQNKRKKQQSKVEGSMHTISDDKLRAARSEILFSTYSYILSSGYVVNTITPPKSSMRIVNNVTDGTDKSKEALALESKDEVGGKIITWWYSSEHASSFVPFSHIVHHGLVQPLYASGRYDEIQVVYFKFNSACGRMSGMNIGDCPITAECAKQYSKQSNAFGIVNYIIKTQINEVMKNKTPYGFKVRNEKSKNGKKTIKVMEPNQTVPKVEYLTRVLTAKDPDNSKKSRKILRISFIDHFCSDDENAGQRIMNSMRDDGRTTAVNPVKTVNMAATEAIRKKMFIKALTESGAIKESDTIDGEKVIQTGPKIFRIIKSAIKASHPHLNYGAMGSALLRASISSEQGGREKMMAHTAAMAHKNSTAGGGRFKDGQAGKPSEIAITEVIGASRSVDIEMIGCPTLQVGSLYFIDFYTETDVDNFYICKKVSHKISNNMFRTTASFHLWDSGGRHTIPNDVDGFERMKSEVEPKLV
jgi:hypothetical protein